MENVCTHFVDMTLFIINVTLIRVITIPSDLVYFYLLSLRCDLMSKYSQGMVHCRTTKVTKTLYFLWSAGLCSLLMFHLTYLFSKCIIICFTLTLFLSQCEPNNAGLKPAGLYLLGTYMSYLTLIVEISSWGR